MAFPATLLYISTRLVHFRTNRSGSWDHMLAADVAAVPLQQRLLSTTALEETVEVSVSSVTKVTYMIAIVTFASSASSAARLMMHVI